MSETLALSDSEHITKNLTHAVVDGNDMEAREHVAYTIILTKNKNGKISPETVKVHKNKSVAFVIASKDRYKIKDVLIDGKSVGTVESYTLAYEMPHSFK